PAGDNRASPTGRRTVLFTNSPPPCQLGHTALDGCAQSERYKTACLPSKTHKVKTHTVHCYPLIAPDVNPFLPSFISTVSVIFISTDHY
ncbi:unnamed protein product, partial [Staurois parvus]